jgi:hypothetical protein
VDSTVFSTGRGHLNPLRLVGAMTCTKEPFYIASTYTGAGPDAARVPFRVRAEKSVLTRRPPSGVVPAR